jgi:hypothetical protein
MPTSVPLRFVPPGDPDIVALHIYEGPTVNGPFSEIEVVNFSKGAAPDEWTTTFASNALDWFAIDWADDKGAFVGMSPALQGGTGTLVAEIVRRVQERDPSLDIRVIAQEAEAVIEQYKGADPYDPNLTATYQEMAGMTYLVLARSIVGTAIVVGNTESATLGLVSFKSSSSNQTTANVQALLDEAYILLGVNESFVMQLPPLCDGYGYYTYDQSRLASLLNVQ